MIGIRTSLFIETDKEMIYRAAKTGTDRVELYTEPYAANYAKDREAAIKPFIEAAKAAAEAGKSGPQCRPRSEPGQLTIFQTKHSRPARGFHRPRPHFQCSLLRVGEYGADVFGEVEVLKLVV
jgi:hypothetical protein